ncbi:ABC transporter permease [Mangrovactinospora gilvigrisea]|uniref:ABC transporter permease n=1 Tax=Mangrovactinospora gilvigrisea TaxID=1428644 RepID=A0A1J7C2Z6_9ACTN|nr:ABC transporter permease subunit [Mangrovactinospora gilvigrisea]OIV35940.1 ABC transporter permease [Mangrovactinospora gilvigrisea]
MSAVLLSEWTKIRTVRSTMWTLILTFLLTVAISMLFGLVVNSTFKNMPAHEKATFDPTSLSFSGFMFGQIALIVFGVLIVSTEYTTSMIRASLAAVPQRGTFMFAKIAVGTVVALVVGMVTSFVAFFTAQTALGSHGAGIGGPHVLRAVFGAGLYATLICMFAMGIAMMLRSSVLSLGILIPLFFIVSPILSAIPKVKTVAKYLPDQAGQRITSTVADPNAAFGPWTGLLILVAWTAASLLGGYLLLKNRDA